MARLTSPSRAAWLGSFGVQSAFRLGNDWAEPGDVCLPWPTDVLTHKLHQTVTRLKRFGFPQARIDQPTGVFCQRHCFFKGRLCFLHCCCCDSSFDGMLRTHTPSRAKEPLAHAARKSESHWKEPVLIAVCRLSIQCPEMAARQLVGTQEVPGEREQSLKPQMLGAQAPHDGPMVSELAQQA